MFSTQGMEESQEYRVVGKSSVGLPQTDAARRSAVVLPPVVSPLKSTMKPGRGRRRRMGAAAEAYRAIIMYGYSNTFSTVDNHWAHEPEGVQAGASRESLPWGVRRMSRGRSSGAKCMSGRRKEPSGSQPIREAQSRDGKACMFFASSAAK